jgi:hypothetical protein
MYVMVMAVIPAVEAEADAVIAPVDQSSSGMSKAVAKTRLDIRAAPWHS